MGKLQSHLQKAIEKSRGVAQEKSHNRDDLKGSSTRHKIADVASNILRKVQSAILNNEVMEESRVVAAIDDPAAKTAYNVLRTRVLQRVRSNNWHSIIVTSAGPGEGKTLTATNLAMSLARDVNQSTILVDLDLTRSSVAKYLGIDEDIKAGIGDFLAGKADVSDILYFPQGMQGLAIVPNREPMENPSDLIGGPEMKALVAQLSDQFERTLVIFDMPPVLACDDVLAFAPNVDAILVVVAQGKTERAELEKTMAMLSDYEMLGVVLNMSDDLRGENADAYY